MEFLCYSESAETALNHFSQLIESIESNTKSRFKARIDACPYHIHLVGLSPFKEVQEKRSNIEDRVIVSLHEAWLSVARKDPNAQAVAGMELICSIGTQITNPHKTIISRGVFRFVDDPERGEFFLLLPADSRGGIALNDILFLCNLWQVEAGNIPLHACGVIHDGGLYIFSGPSGAGKSTIGALSSEVGGELLDEDQLAVWRRPDGAYAANAWGYSLQTSDSPARGFFRLKKAKMDGLTPLAETRTACLIMEQSLAVALGALPEKNLTSLFRNVAELARSVPGYELHFHKSPEFWKLIDTEITKSKS